MKYNLDRPIRFSRDAEHKSLYSWSLQELSTSGEKLSRDLIPWDWTLRFVAIGLRLHSEFGLKRIYGDESTPKMERHTSVALVAPLRLDKEYSSESRYRGTKMTMMGTDRELTSIGLRIEPLANEDEPERCTLWGSPSFTTDIDFRDHTTEDTLGIQLSVAPARFRELCELIRAPHPIALSVMVSRAAGIYSDWSPAIGTDSVKILTDREAHLVDSEPEGDLLVPRLGEVGAFELSVIQHAAVHAPKLLAEADDAELLEDSPNAGVTATTPEFDALREVRGELAGARKSVASLSAPIWIAVVLLGLLLLFR